MLGIGGLLAVLGAWPLGAEEEVNRTLHGGLGFRVRGLRV